MGAAVDREGREPRELMSAADVGRTISRIAHQIIEKTALDSPDAPRVVLLGIPTRGVILASRLATNIDEYSGVEVGHGALDITLYRDDLRSKPPRPLEATSIPAGGVDDALVILVDDVCTPGGRCARPSMRCATWAGRARCNWRCWSTAATVNCRCAPTTSARTCRPRAARACTFCSASTMVSDGVVISRDGADDRICWPPVT